MKIALVTTTIYVPRVLAHYRELDPEVEIFVAGDRKTPHDEVRSFIASLGNAHYYSDEDQDALGFACSPIIGWNRIMRRNIALLEAIKSGAEIIVSIDDDNIPLAAGYFDDFRRILGRPYDGICVETERGWFNAGELLDPLVYHRGFPYAHRHVDLGIRMHAVTSARIGVAAGLWVGDPDIDAMERLTNRPIVRRPTTVGELGVAVATGCLAPFNTQNTAFVRELAPLLMVLIAVGRYDDIWASYIAQRVMSEHGYLLHFGPPIVWQDRNPHNLWQNLKDEIYGMETGTRFAEDLADVTISGMAVIDALRTIHEHVARWEYVPDDVARLGLAWCDDVESVLG
jgi:Reversibly glycosylated polypeptide